MCEEGIATALFFSSLWANGFIAPGISRKADQNLYNAIVNPGQEETSTLHLPSSPSWVFTWLTDAFTVHAQQLRRDR